MLQFHQNESKIIFIANFKTTKIETTSWIMIHLKIFDKLLVAFGSLLSKWNYHVTCKDILVIGKSLLFLLLLR